MDPYVGELRIFPWAFAPKGWALCNGQILPIQQNAALFSLLGITYGGNGTTNFALPDLRSRVPIDMGPTTREGAILGSENTTLTANNLPAHTHTLIANISAAGVLAVGGNMIAATAPVAQFAPATNAPVPMAGTSISVSGTSAPISNMQPSLVLNICIALTGIWPPRS